MPELTIPQSLNKAYRQLKIEKIEFDRFKKSLRNLFTQINENEVEEKLKGDIMDFLKESFYTPGYKIAPTGHIDCVIHLGNNSDAPIGVIFEVKKPGSQEMITRNDINRKALQEIILYYLRERIENKNIQLKYFVVSSIFEFFIFDAHEFEKFFANNKELCQYFDDFTAGRLPSNKTDFFYKEIASKYIEAVKDKITYTYFDLRNYRHYLDTNKDKKLIELYKIFSPSHLLKLPFQNDSNSLNKNFYSELLYIMGLEEVGDKGKRIITRRNPNERNEASIIESTIDVLDSEDCLHYVENLASYGTDRKSQLFNIALELSINWINRILFLKLLEAQMIKYHKGDKAYAFMNPTNISDYDELNDLFFKVLARKINTRTASINSRYSKVPYLNSSLFEINQLEGATIRISNLGNQELPIWSGTVLKENNKPRYKRLPTLRYLLEFLDAYDFASEGEEGIEERAKTLINASVLGLIFEKINGHRDGSVFTPGAITMYMCREAIRHVIVQKFNAHFGWSCANYDALKNKDIPNLIEANHVVNSIRLCDPAVGSGHFLVSALNEIIATKFDLGILLDCEKRRIKKQNYQIEINSDELIITDADGDVFNYMPGHPESQRIQEALFKEKRTIIENCLFGVDINPNSVNICRLRLWIELLKNAYYTRESNFTELETLPNIDINIKSGNSLLHRFDLQQSISQVLQSTGISIAEYKKAVTDYQNAHSKEEKRQLDEMIARIKSTLTTEINRRDPKQTRLLRRRLELSDLQGQELFSSTEWTSKQMKERQKVIKKYSEEVKKLEAYFNEIKSNKMYLGAFEWRIEFPEVLDDEGNFIGFDCIIGNPPYIQLQSMGHDSETLGRMGYQSYERTGDIYCLFYELGMNLLKPDCLLSFITSNKWMRAGYGKALRHYFVEQTNPIQLIDFAGTRIFDSATVDVNILMLTKQANAFETRSCSIKKDGFEINKLSDYFLQNSSICSFKSSDSWVVLSPIELSIKQKIEAIGTPLKDWDIQINYGIKTGFNEAFIIDGEKRAELIAADPKCAEIIRPILRGRDIKRYNYEFADLWLINTHNGIKEKGISRIDIGDYPTIKAHLDQYWDQISTRADKGDTPYNLRNCAYMDDFSKQKIIWAELARTGNAFTYDDSGAVVLNTCYILTFNNEDQCYIKNLLAILNSKLILFYMNLISSKLDETGWRWLKQFVELLPIPDKIAFADSLIRCVDDTLSLKKNDLTFQNEEEKINNIVYNTYGLTEEEIFLVDSFIKDISSSVK